jgi:sodium/proline symporter
MLIALFAAVGFGAVWASKRTHHTSDYLIANRRLGAALAICGYVGGATNAWVLVLVTSAAFMWGLSAVWLAAGLLSSAVLSMGYIAPRLRAMAAGQDSMTLTQFISTDAGDRLQPIITRSAAAIAILMLVLQVSGLVRAAADFLSFDAGYSIGTTAVLGVALVTASVLAGGLRAASVCDAIQTIAMGVALLLLPVPAIVALGGWEALMSGIAALGPSMSDWFAGKSGVVALALAGGAIGLGLAIPGQPHAMARLMAVRDGGSLLKMRCIAPVATAVLLALALLCGWCTRVLYDGLQQPEQALHALATRLLPPSVAAVFVVALFGSLLVSVASPLLAIASQCSVDLRRSASAPSAGWTRAALVLVAIVAAVLALLAPLDMTKHGLLPFVALGATFGPLLLVRLTGKRIRPGSQLGAMWAGFLLTIVFHFLPDSPGDFLERVLPFVAALGIALTGGERRRNPDRADRAQETVHDRIPI